MFYQPADEQKIRSPPLKSLPCCEIGTVSLIASITLKKNISVRESHPIVIRNLDRLTFSRKTLANVLKLDASK